MDVISKKGVGVIVLGIVLMGAYALIVSNMYPKLHTLFLQTDSLASEYSAMGVDTRSVHPQINNARNTINRWDTRVWVLKQKRMYDELVVYKGALDALYKQEITTGREELAQRLLPVRSRLVTSSFLDEGVRQQIYLELERISYSHFDAKTTPKSIRQSLGRLGQLEELMTQSEEIHKRTQLTAQLEEYRRRCSSFAAFFSSQQKEDVAQRAQVCVDSVARFASDQYRANSTDYVKMLVEEDIPPLLSALEREKESLVALENQRKKERREAVALLDAVPSAPFSTGKVIVIDLLLQRLYAYKDGVSVFAAAVPVTTGKNGFETVRGSFEIYDKQSPFRMRSPFPDIYYDNTVEYWMPFFLGYGLHDASWRQVYGTQDYTAVGSHGCVNVPRDMMAVLYNWAELRTRVIVQ